MATPIGPLPLPSAVPTHAGSLEATGGRFADLLARDAAGVTEPPLAATLRDAASRLSADQRYVDRVIDRLRRGGVVDSVELLSLQAGVYRYSQEIELATRVVDKATNAIRQTVQSQG